MKTSSSMIVLVAAALLAGCGGGGGDPAPIAASDAVPDAASASAEGMVAWIAALGGEDTESKEPLDLVRFNPAAADDTEPLALD